MVYPLEGILGGTFDPIHCGHLAIAEFVTQHCPIKKLHFLPCLEPPHRNKPQASAQQRLDMVRLVVADNEKWVVNDLDYQRPAPSYMIDTLQILKKHQPNTSWCLILGMDAFSSFDQWREWRKILNTCHLIVINRPNFTLSSAPWCQNLSAHFTNEPQKLTETLSGYILFLTMTPCDISATQIRGQKINQLEKAVPDSILSYIKIHHLYNRI